MDPDELAAFATDGVLIRRGFVAPELVDTATGLIHDWYERGVASADLAGYTQRSFAPELGTHPAVTALFTDSGAAEIARTLLGEIAPVSTAQIQIRVPERNCPVPQPEKAMHVDGVACPHLDPAELRTFSLLVGVVLSEITDERGGALRYVRGGHLPMARWFREEWALGMTTQTPPHIDASSGTPLLGHPGDLLLMHHLVPHAVGRNHLEQPRVMAYFRVSHTHHARRRLDALRNPWLDYPGITTGKPG